ncbi:hypothetical protein GCM10017771_93440 [Streptomyces capitiformicae]|uniref:Uncharacterized protein n=1 Tax=Streptomyces capitiformicae TaxID=2014920 RepID=A0A918ZTJ0_9ACTN|nr:hypothetical protein GCM10017771_93440 [Streptomyces capitiformicae]
MPCHTTATKTPENPTISSSRSGPQPGPRRPHRLVGAAALLGGADGGPGASEGYWFATSRAYPDSPGWSQQEQQQVAALREKARDVTGVILTHAFWDGVAAPHRPDARSQLKYALDVHEDSRDQEV